ncbi:hypothetical protein BH10CYA1_BH10CYA1_62930 [soil metagenome]
MENDQRTVTITLTPAQFAALTDFAVSEQCDIAVLVQRGVDTFVATYGPHKIESRLEARLIKMHEHTVKLLVSLMKLLGQAVYFSSLPLTNGPVKAKLNREGVLLHWQQSEHFASDLLKPPQTIKPKAK